MINLFILFDLLLKGVTVSNNYYNYKVLTETII